MMDEHTFTEWCYKNYVEERSTHSVVTLNFITLVLRYLQCLTPEQESDILGHMDRAKKASFKYKVKEKKYSWVTLPAMNGNGETVLTVPKKKGDGYLIVVPVERFFSTLKSLHESSGHARKFTMWNKITRMYSGLPRTVLEKFLKGCVHCQCRAAQVNEPEPKPIKASKLFERLQVDLIDLSTRPSGDYKYILHLMDHFSKFHMLHPLRRKTADEVNNGLMVMLGTVGLPLILQTDNGSEFSQLGKIFENWPGAGDVKIIHGRPAHPQSQGLVERGHRLVQDRLAITEAQWLQSRSEPFEWHQLLPIIQYQVNTAHCSTTQEMPYTIVFGREPKLPPIFGREGHVHHESNDSFSTAYDHENSDRELETNPEDENGNILNTEEQPCTSNETNPEDENTNNLNTEEQPTTSNETNPEDENTNNLNTEEQPTTSNETNRHSQFRQSALLNLEKAYKKRVNQTKPRKKTDQITVGSFVTVAVPKEYRHKCDLRRIAGIVINKRGDKQNMFMIRTETGVIDGWFGADSVQIFDGVLPLVVDGWEHCQVLPLRVAAAAERKSKNLPTRCGCKTSCTKNSCRCHKSGNVCTSSCHAGRPCLNRASEPVEATIQEPTSIAEELNNQLIRDLRQSSYSNDECEKTLDLLSGVGTIEFLDSLGKQTLHEFPPLPDLPPHSFDGVNLLTYGSGYMNYVPVPYRTSHKVFNVSGEGNLCFYNSVSMVLYGNEKHSSTLKLWSVLFGIQHLDEMVLKISDEITNEDEVVGWAAGFAPESLVDSLSGNKLHMIKTVVKSELIGGLAANDSGPVQILAMAKLTGRPIKMNCNQAHALPETVYGEGDNPIEILRVPFNTQPRDGHVRYNHFVPAIKRKLDDEEVFIARCAAHDIGCCAIADDRIGMEYVACDDCMRWFHSVCISHSVRTHTMKRQSTMSCGCLRSGPFKPSSSLTSMLTSEKEISKVLQEQRPFLKVFLTDLLHKKIPSWRVNTFQNKPNIVKQLQSVSGLTIPTDEVAIKIRLFIDQQLPSPVTVNYKECVLFPEMLMKIFSIIWNINKVEAEYIFQQAGMGNKYLL